MNDVEIKETYQPYSMTCVEGERRGSTCVIYEDQVEREPETIVENSIVEISPDTPASFYVPGHIGTYHAPHGSNLPGDSRTSAGADRSVYLQAFEDGTEQFTCAKVDVNVGTVENGENVDYWEEHFVCGKGTDGIREQASSETL